MDELDVFAWILASAGVLPASETEVQEPLVEAPHVIISGCLVHFPYSLLRHLPSTPSVSRAH